MMTYVADGLMSAFAFAKDHSKQMMDEKKKQDKDQETFNKNSDPYARRLRDGFMDTAVHVEDEKDRAHAQVSNAKDAVRLLRDHLDVLAQKSIIAVGDDMLRYDGERLALMALLLQQLTDWVFQDKKTSHLSVDGNMHDWGVRACKQLRLVHLTHPDRVSFQSQEAPRVIRRFVSKASVAVRSAKSAPAQDKSGNGPKDDKSGEDPKPKDAKKDATSTQSHKRKREHKVRASASLAASTKPKPAAADSSAAAGGSGSGSGSGSAFGSDETAIRTDQDEQSEDAEKDTDTDTDTDDVALDEDWHSSDEDGESEVHQPTARSSKKQRRTGKATSKPRERKQAQKPRVVFKMPEFTVKITRNLSDHKLYVENLSSDIWRRVVAGTLRQRSL
jgi:hypothetical protein